MYHNARILPSGCIWEKRELILARKRFPLLYYNPSVKRKRGAMGGSI